MRAVSASFIVAWSCVAACQHEPSPRTGHHGATHTLRARPETSTPPAAPLTVSPTPLEVPGSVPAPSEPEHRTEGHRENDRACTIVLSIDIQEFGRTRKLRVQARNRTGTTVSFDVPERCPNGPIDFEGLGPGYDYYGTCASGACVGWAPTRRITIAPHDVRTLAEAMVMLDGREPCTKPLAPGRYVVRPIAPPTTVSICTEEVVLVVPEPLSEAEIREASKDPYWCQSSADCVLSCPSAPGCCGDPCGCRHAINVRHRDAYEANYPKTCDRPPCPAVACAYQPAISAVCLNNRCVGTRTLAP
ncbi:MAG: hypothetical protein DIU78_019650 [Pseudomonadota bacterium]